MKCSKCGKNFTARDTAEYTLVKRKGHHNDRFCSIKCLQKWAVDLTIKKEQTIQSPLMEALTQ